MWWAVPDRGPRRADVREAPGRQRCAGLPGRCAERPRLQTPRAGRAQVGVVTDIRGRRSTAEAMHLCDKALAATSEAIVITDPNIPDNPIVYCNAGFEKLTGAPCARRRPVRAGGCVQSRRVELRWRASGTPGPAKSWRARRPCVKSPG